MWNTMASDIRARILANITADRTDIESLTVLETEHWPAGTSSLTPTHVGSITVEYDRFGHQAIYGFDAAGNVQCYMD